MRKFICKNNFLKYVLKDGGPLQNSLTWDKGRETYQKSAYVSMQTEGGVIGEA